MAELNLKARTALNAQRFEYAGIAIEEITNRAIVSVATPLAGTLALENALQRAYGAILPIVGKFTTGSDGGAIMLGLSIDQFFLMFDNSGSEPTAIVRDLLGENAYVVDQSDSWAMIRMSGDNCRAALERICPIDLHPQTFSEGCVTRTSMEHLATIIACEAVNTYLLLSPRSSANSFLHAIDTSARHVT